MTPSLTAAQARDRFISLMRLPGPPYCVVCDESVVGPADSIVTRKGLAHKRCVETTT